MSLLYALIMFRVGIRSGLRMSRSGPHHHIYIRYRTRTLATSVPTASPGRKRKKIEERQRGDPSVVLFLVSSERASMTAGDPEKRLQNVMDKLYRAPKPKPSLPRSLPPETLEKILQFFFPYVYWNTSESILIGVLLVVWWRWEPVGRERNRVGQGASRREWGFRPWRQRRWGPSGRLRHAGRGIEGISWGDCLRSRPWLGSESPRFGFSVFFILFPMKTISF